ncbi:5-methyltetrahydropteroyltriglutamate--homocysteine S-methyltransferase [Planctomycetales bacterium 10988]|nr:5-methyltetrahydropteroyltriglutamate--homocysteine S-methyltransferase [Planctomycetales bacterium 10988]
MAIATNFGFPRIGTQRELKKAVEAYWKQKLSAEELSQTCRELRLRHWKLQQASGIEQIPSNDFSLYDQVLDMTAMLGAVPARYDWSGETVDLDTYFAMARGRAGKKGESDVAAMEMTKWFDTNYHYIVPELTADQKFRLASRKAIDEFTEAKEAGMVTRPVLIGPITYLLLSKCEGDAFDRFRLLERMLPVYEELLQDLAAVGAQWVQIDEPALVLDLDEKTLAAFAPTYQRLKEASPSLSLLVATYFGDLRENLETACQLPVDGLHVDLVHGLGQLEAVLKAFPTTKHLSLGVVDGRNIWKTDLGGALGLIREAEQARGSERLMIGPSCSLLHSPIDLDLEVDLDPEIQTWLAFAKQKLQEISTLTQAINGNEESVRLVLEENLEAIRARKISERVHQPHVKYRLEAITSEMSHRQSPFTERALVQRQAIKLPVLPTTTIGSFPQTKDLRKVRADYKAGRIDEATYDSFIKQQIDDTIRFQEEVGLDVLVHGEAERNDMVEYFGEQLDGFTFTKNGWVQSYGSRCVKPPIIFGDVSRPKAMTVDWINYAQSKTSKPVKGMLTGPVTILQWSFVRNDQPRSVTCRQIALAIRDEVVDLEKAGVQMIQIDEAALREGLPLRRRDWEIYLTWAVDCFRLTASRVKDQTQIHTHMCYSEFNDIIPSISDMDADVISIESSRSKMELLKAFEAFQYPNEIGPGVYDIHSPRIPSEEEMAELLRSACKVLPPERVWVNPDCGLKTRGWPEVKESLKNMIGAAQALRKELTTV